jgi:DNA-binding transcriptional MerR regulator
LWDTVSLGLVFLGVAMVMARWYFLGKFRKELDKKGLSIEEYKTMLAELKNDRDASLKSVEEQVKARKMDTTRAKQAKAQIRDTYVTKVNALRSGTLAGMMGGGA